VWGVHEAGVAYAVFVYFYTDRLVFLMAFWVLGSAAHVATAGTKGPCSCTEHSIVFSL